jgi:hypothetical protein
MNITNQNILEDKVSEQEETEDDVFNDELRGGTDDSQGTLG